MNYAILIKEKVWKVVSEKQRAITIVEALLARNLPARWEETNLPESESFNENN